MHNVLSKIINIKIVHNLIRTKEALVLDVASRPVIPATPEAKSEGA